ncbi:DNA-binding protein [Aureibacter tunicatorum]|nr:DNA-binding protein [Aureibacter tunicatorum]
MPLERKDFELINRYFVYEEIPAQSILLNAGDVERHAYFLISGVVKGYQNIDGKLVVQHLVSDNDFFTSLDSFILEMPSNDTFETVTTCAIMKISKGNYNLLQEQSAYWNKFVKELTNNHLRCKLERVKDFQTLTAKERYLKFIDQHPNLAMNVSVDNIASFLGMEPQSLSRIRRQVAF